MPEVVTKYPDAFLTVMKSSGAKCGAGEPQKILTKCPKEKFCSYPGGETCVYGLEEIPRMTQATPQEFAAVVCKAEGKKDVSPGEMGLAVPGLTLAAGLLAGAVGAHRWLRRLRLPRG
jgi:hypothetical protein